jgi:hypothetical protein
LEYTSGLLPGEIEDQIGRGQEARCVGFQDGFVGQILGDHRLCRAMGATTITLARYVRSPR